LPGARRDTWARVEVSEESGELLVVVLCAAHIAISATDVAPSGPLHLTGVTSRPRAAGLAERALR